MKRRKCKRVKPGPVVREPVRVQVHRLSREEKRARRERQESLFEGVR